MHFGVVEGHANIWVWTFNSFSKTRNFLWKEERGNTNDVGPSSIKTLEEELGDFKGGKDSFKKEVGGETCIKIDSKTNKICFARS
jgi:hypothetical protein